MFPNFENSIDNKDKVCYVWETVVESYSKRSLTRESDKLVAIGGIAKELQRFLQDEYLAGLWNRDLLRELL